MGIYALGTNGILQFIVSLLVLALVVVLCYFTTRFIASYQKGVVGRGNIEVLEAKNVGANKLIEIVRIGGDYYAIGVSKDNITLIGSVDKDTLIYDRQETVKSGDSFGQIFDRIRTGRKPKDK